jgi:hypothetical protein
METPPFMIDLGKKTTSRRDRTLFHHGYFLGNHPQMAQHFRSVKYYNLPRLESYGLLE